jgi:hypothetical protein
MASNWLYIDTNFPTFTGEESTDEKVTTIQNYMFMLVEQLRYTLHNLDLKNMNGTAVEQFKNELTEPIYARIEDDEGNISQLALTAQDLTARMSDAEGNITTLQVTAQGLVSTVSNQAGQISSLQQTASGLSATVANQAGEISSLQLTAQGLASRVTNAEDDISSLQQTANSISATVASQAGQISSLQITTSGLSSTVSNQSGQISSLWQTVNGFSLSVSNGSIYSTLSLKSNGVVISSANITLTGMVTFMDLSTNGWSTINGGNITTGTIMANNVGVSNRFSLYSGGWLYGYMGCGYGMDGDGNYTYGALLASANDRNYMIATNAGVRMTANSTSIYCVSGGPHATANIIVDSDRNVKHDIGYDMEKLEAFFQELRPCRYRLNKEFDGRLHTGFIAQDVEEALAKSGLAYDDFAGLVRNPRLDPEYSLAYGEFAALNTHMIQMLIKRVEALERRAA